MAKLLALLLHGACECLAVKKDLDFRKNLIHVAQRWYHGKFDLPKGNRDRYVDMSQQLKAVLQFAQTARKANSDLLFSGSNPKTPIDASSLTKNYFKPTLKRPSWKASRSTTCGIPSEAYCWVQGHR